MTPQDTSPSAEILEKVKELQKIVEKYDRLVLANAGSIYGTEITDLLPPILTFCLEHLAKKNQSVRGIVIVGEKDRYLDYALSEVADKVSLKIYQIQFSLLE